MLTAYFRNLHFDLQLITDYLEKLNKYLFYDLHTKITMIFVVK